MAGPEETAGGRSSGRERAVGYQRYVVPDDLADQVSLFPPLESPIEIGADGRPTGVELEDLAGADDHVAEPDPDGISAPFRPSPSRSRPSRPPWTCCSPASGRT
ncbi:hypothetical protein [Streptomyces albidoflavus]|uniref:hypothetical protein n=1 Tax=Streptomyces albidoflavus TaxID=1886 RepID=UPI0021486CC5|nr:hypothetical protein [Streptomyces albidoflavus]MCR0989038.1 hypothetical protein [Streptomyces albidoflavus]